MTIINEEALNERANDLDAKGLNGFRLVLVETNETKACLKVHFHNTTG